MATLNDPQRILSTLAEIVVSRKVQQRQIKDPAFLDLVRILTAAQYLNVDGKGGFQLGGEVHRYRDNGLSQ